MEIDEDSRIQHECKLIVDKWCLLFSKDLLTERDFIDYWKTRAPTAFILHDNKKPNEWIVKEDFVQNVLINSLEGFICCGNRSDFFSYLSECSRSVCGKILKAGEVCYHCRDCATDVTCVICANCFNQSPHRYHRYKMGTLLRGGCCDCGDTEALKSDSCCDSHLAVKGKDMPTFPQDWKKRGERVFTAIIQFCYEVLNSDYSESYRNYRLRVTENPNVAKDLFCTVVYDRQGYGDDVNVFKTVLECSSKTALDYITSKRKEGRTIVKCSYFVQCITVRREIEELVARNKYRSVKATVVGLHGISHQMFALRLLKWLEKLVSLSKEFRQIFTSLAMSIRLTDESCSAYQQKVVRKPRLLFVEEIILNDTYLWKTARLHWHRLFLAAMCVENENKKDFAEIFTRHYEDIMKNFIRENHDYSFSFASFSIQLFTVPSLAHHLIAAEDALHKLLNTFVAVYSRIRNGAGRLDFNQTPSFDNYNRAMYILHDLRYLLHSPPESWSDELRKSFLKGVITLLIFFECMQGMNPIMRQVIETPKTIALNLQNELTPIISLTLKWCSSDRNVFVEVFRLTLKKLFEHCSAEHNTEKEKRVARHKAICYKYDVSNQPVSMYLPLSRFLAGLFLLLGKFGLTYYSDEFSFRRKPSPKQIIEPPLRVQVMMTHVDSGLWRNNTFTIMDQIAYYRNIKHMKEVQDKDIVLLQIGASLIDSNEYLIHLLNKFKLMDWIDPKFETTLYNTNPSKYLKTSPIVVEEFLTLLVRIVSERFLSGVGEVTANDCLENEIIHQLFISSFSHSELNTRIPDEMYRNETGMENVIDNVANFKKQTQNPGKGYYEVKSELLDKYNAFFYHYSREDMSKSTEEQIKQRKNTCGIECCPPPKLPRFTKNFEPTINLLQCDVMLYIMKTVLERALDIRVRSSTEGHLRAVLHLIGRALQEQECNYMSTKFTEKAEKSGINNLMDKLLDSPQCETNRPLIRWTVDKYRKVASPLKTNEEVEEIDFKMENDSDLQDKNIRAQMVAKKRAEMLADIAAMQKKFWKDNAYLFEEKFSLQESVTTSCDSDCNSMDCDLQVALGANQSAVSLVDRTLTCIFCQEEQGVQVNGTPLIIASYIQTSSVLALQKSELFSSNQILSSNIGPGLHLSSCGHVMHTKCWKEFYTTLIHKKILYKVIDKPSKNKELLEYLCPLCQRLSNTILPVIPQISAFRKPDYKNPEQISFNAWHEICTIIMEGDNTSGESETPENQSTSETEAFDITKHLLSIKDFKPGTKKYNDQELIFEGAHEVINIFVNENITEDKYWRVSRTCAYTIHSLERLLRHKNKSLFGDFTSREQDCLENLIRLSGVLAINDKKESGRNVCVQILKRLFSCERKESVLQWDSLGILIPLTITMPFTYYNDVSPLPFGKSIEKHCLKIALFVHFAQTILCTDLSEMVYLLNDNVTSEDTLCLADIVKKLKDCQNINTIEIWELWKKLSMSFLRSAAIFFHFLTGVSVPENLKVVGGETYENLMNYLGMPTNCKKLFGEPCVVSIFKSWAQHPDCVQLRHQVTIRSMTSMNELVNLPEDYSEVIYSAASSICPNTNEQVENPTMCLICGRMICFKSVCCQNELRNVVVGGCNYHAHVCGAGVGIFLRVDNCEILLLDSQNKGCLIEAPYLDEYGETDQGLKRGNRMTLWKERYRYLQYLWLSHGIPEHIACITEYKPTFNLWQSY